MAGLTDNGFIPKTLPEIIQEKQEEITSAFGANSNTEPESVFGQSIAISAERENDIWELLEKVYLSQYPSTADKTSLDLCVGLNLIKRKGVKFSTISDQAFWGTATTIVPAGTRIKVTGATSVYATDEELTLGAGVNQIQRISFNSTPVAGSWNITFRGETTGPLTYSATNAEVKTALELLSSVDEVTVTGDITTYFEITFTGTNVKFRKNPVTVVQSTLTNGLSALVIVTESIHTEGVYQAIGSMTAIESGSAYFAPANSLKELENSISGINLTFNESVSSKGYDKETDFELFNRRANSLGRAGSGTTDAIRAAVLGIDEISSCIVFENDTIYTGISGRPGKCFEVFVYQKSEIGGGSPDPDVDRLVAEAIARNKAAGMQAYGAELPIYVLDAAGFSKAIYFSRPTQVPIYLILELTTTPSVFPINGITAVCNDIVIYGNAIGQGNDVIVYPYLMDNLGNYEGITDVVTKIGESPLPTADDNITIDDGTLGGVETSVWLPENIQVINNSVTYTYNPVTLEWEA